MAITSAVSDLIHSFYELISSIFSTVYAIIHGVFSAVAGFLGGILHLAGNIVNQAVAVAGGVTQFVLGNFVLLAVGALLAVGFVRYTSQGKKVANKKTQ